MDSVWIQLKYNSYTITLVIVKISLVCKLVWPLQFPSKNIGHFRNLGLYWIFFIFFFISRFIWGSILHCLIRIERNVQWGPAHIDFQCAQVLLWHKCFRRITDRSIMLSASPILKAHMFKNANSYRLIEWSKDKGSCFRKWDLNPLS